MVSGEIRVIITMFLILVAKYVIKDECIPNNYLFHHIFKMIIIKKIENKINNSVKP